MNIQRLIKQLILASLFILATLASAAPVLSIEAFHRARPQSGLVVVEGYLVGSYRCPPCPKDAMCKLCAQPSPSITLGSVNYPPRYQNVSERDVLTTRLENRNQYLVIDAGFLQGWTLPDDAKKPEAKGRVLQLNQKYRVTLQITTKTDHHPGQWDVLTTWHAQAIEPVTAQ